MRNGLYPSSPILCVDDSTDTIEMLKVWLQLKGYEVLCARTCREALAMAEQHPVKVCIIDHRLPDGTGVELARNVHQR